MAILEKLLRSKLVVVTLIVLPGLWPVLPMFVQQDASVLADPLKYLLHHLGFTASILLAVVLTLSPLRAIFPRWKIALVLQRHRRLIGVSTFVYAALHVTSHFLYEGGFATFARDYKKPFIAVGLIAFSILFVLTLTSLNVAVRWLGARRWKWLHRLVYVAAALVAYHQISARKIFPVQVLWIFIPLVVLELLRIARHFAARRSSPITNASPLVAATPRR